MLCRPLSPDSRRQAVTSFRIAMRTDLRREDVEICVLEGSLSLGHQHRAVEELRDCGGAFGLEQRTARHSSALANHSIWSSICTVSRLAFHQRGVSSPPLRLQCVHAWSDGCSALTLPAGSIVPHNECTRH